MCPTSAEVTTARTETHNQNAELLICSFGLDSKKRSLLMIFPPPAPPHLADDAVLHVGLLVASLLAHQSDLQLTERFGQDVTLCEELPPLHDVGLQQCSVILVTQHPLTKSEKHKTD